MVDGGNKLVFSDLFSNTFASFLKRNENQALKTKVNYRLHGVSYYNYSDLTAA